MPSLAKDEAIHIPAAGVYPVHDAPVWDGNDKEHGNRPSFTLSPYSSHVQALILFWGKLRTGPVKREEIAIWLRRWL
ncbi:hypothetical protein ACFLXC_01625 [Chloroflexota bacterium]